MLQNLIRYSEIKIYKLLVINQLENIFYQFLNFINLIIN